MISTTKNVWLDLDPIPSNTINNNTLWRASSILSFTLGSSSSSSELHALGHERTPQWQRLVEWSQPDPSHQCSQTTTCFWNVKQKKINQQKPSKNPFNQVFSIPLMSFKTKTTRFSISNKCSNFAWIYGASPNARIENPPLVQQCLKSISPGKHVAASARCMAFFSKENSPIPSMGLLYVPTWKL